MINSTILMGRLTYEPELKTTSNGTSVIRFQIACDRRGSKEENKADFIDCQAWRNTAEFISKYFHKGDMIAIEGSIQTDSFKDKDGNSRKSVVVVAANVSFCGAKGSGSNGSAKNTNNAKAESFSQPAPSYAGADMSDFEEIVDDDDDLPF